jgi:Ca2+-transporting ATPase
VGLVSLVKGFGSLAVFLLLVKFGRDIDETRTVVFTVMALSSLASIFSLKHLHHTLMHKMTWNNKRLILAVAFGVLLQMLVIYMPWGQKLFHTVPLPPADWLLILSLPILSVASLEVVKFVAWRRRRVAEAVT